MEWCKTFCGRCTPHRRFPTICTRWNPLHHVYNELLKLHRCGNKTWCDNIVKTLDSIGLTDAWSLYKNGTPFDHILPMLPNIKMCLENSYKQTWTCEVNDQTNNPILRTYRLFKSDHNFESYLLCRNYRIRKYLTKFRVSSHDLQIEKGRHSKPKIPLSLRLCRHCDSQCIDNEYHFLTECPFHHCERLALESVVRTNFPNFSEWNENIFVQILKCEEYAVQIALGKYIYTAFSNRWKHDQS